MNTELYIAIPAKYSNKTLTIKSLGFKTRGDTPEEALIECISNSALYESLILAKFNYIEHRGKQHLQLEVPFNNNIYDKLIEIEPFPEIVIKKKTTKSFLIEPSFEETVKFGY